MPKGPLHSYMQPLASITGEGWHPGLGVGKRPHELTKPSEEDVWVTGKEAAKIVGLTYNTFMKAAREYSVSWKRGRHRVKYFKKSELILIQKKGRSNYSTIDAEMRQQIYSEIQKGLTQKTVAQMF